MTPDGDDYAQRIRRQEEAELKEATAACLSEVPARIFKAISDNRFVFYLPDIGVQMDVDRLRREHHELVGELSVKCDLKGARPANGNVLSWANFNLSSARARTERANLLKDRSNTHNKVDWLGVVEQFCQLVLEAERCGQPEVDLRQVARPDANDVIKIEGFIFPRRHPTILFGDGGSAKSYTALWLAGKMVEKGMIVALFDWELAGEDHRERLERLFPDGMPRIVYARCERPLVSEVDRLARIVTDNGVDFVMYDSIAFACDGPPESAEVAGAYFRAVRQIGGGSLHVAHVNRSENGDQKPFGSSFWHNGARSTWFVKRAEEGTDLDMISLGFFHRKSNLGRLQRPVGFTLEFTETTTSFRRSDVAETPELAERLSVVQRMEHLLRGGSKTVTQIANELEVEVNTVTQTVNRYVRKGRTFIVLDGMNTNRRIGLLGS